LANYDRIIRKSEIIVCFCKHTCRYIVLVQYSIASRTRNVSARDTRLLHRLKVSDNLQMTQRTGNSRARHRRKTCFSLDTALLQVCYSIESSYPSFTDRKFFFSGWGIHSFITAIYMALYTYEPVIELLGVLGGLNPPVNFSTPQLILKNYLGGVKQNPPQ